MFGYQGGEPADLLQRKVLERQSAKDEWPFLTTLDLSTIHSEQQLASMVKDRTGLKLEEVIPSVHTWMEGYNRRLATPSFSQGKVVNLRRSPVGPSDAKNTKNGMHHSSKREHKNDLSE